MPTRAYTADEIRDQLITDIWSAIRYWGGHDGSNAPPDYTPDQRLSGLAHSILSALDGCRPNLPAFKLQVDPHPDDEGFHKEEGSNWYPADLVIEDMLHEHLYSDHLRRDQ